MFKNMKLLTSSMQHDSSRETKTLSPNQEIPSILLNMNVHYRTHKSPPTVSTLSQIDPVYPPHLLLKIYFNISFLLRTGFPSAFFPSGFPHQNPKCM